MSQVPANESNRRFPNEVSALIIDHLGRDFRTLKNVALVCKDFAYLSRAHIFGEIDLHMHPSDSRARQLIALLSKSHAQSSINTSVQTLRVHVSSSNRWATEPAELLQNLPSLTNISISLPTSEHFKLIGSNFGGRLRELRMVNLFFRAEDVQLFQSMLLSLVTLNTLRISGASLYPGEVSDMLILPVSLKFVWLYSVQFSLLRAIGKGMRVQPIMLHAIFLHLFDPSYYHIEDSHPQFWAGLGLHIPVVLMVDDPPRDHGHSLPYFKNRMLGLELSQLTFACYMQTYALFQFFTALIPIIPQSVRRICIDINASHEGFFFAESLSVLDWQSLDTTLCRRHNEGLLDRVCFRCTTLTDPFGYLSIYPDCYPEHRSILSEIEHRLPESIKLGFIDVDHVTKVFKLTM